MSHQVKPVSFRAGKTQPWGYNVLLQSKNTITSNESLLSTGLIKLSKTLLRRKRLYAVRGNLVNRLSGKINYRLIYAPKIKTKPREHSTGAFIRRSIYKPFNWIAESAKAKVYVERRKNKTAKIHKRFRPKKLNKWLLRRMFRGAGKVIWGARKKAPLPYKQLSGPKSLKLLQYIIGQNIIVKPQAIHRINRPASKRLKKKRRFWRTDLVKSRQFNNRRFSLVVTNLLQAPIKITTINLFAYLSAKSAVTYKTHQNHFWNLAYRRYRFQYKNYFDVNNAFLALALVDYSEIFLLTILRATLPVILKIRKFFKYLDAVIRNMPEIQDKFAVFKVHIAGKLAGGTKRTKSHSIGFGVLSVQTIANLSYNSFLSYRHIYGEFGVKLVASKHDKYKCLTLLS